MKETRPGITQLLSQTLKKLQPEYIMYFVVGVLVIAVVSLLIATLYTSNIPPQGIFPGDRVYIARDNIQIKDGQMCREIFSMTISPYGPDGGTWWHTLGFGYLVYLTRDSGGEIYAEYFHNLHLTPPETCLNIKK